MKQAFIGPDRSSPVYTAIEVDAPGFDRLSRTDVDVEVGQVVALDLTLAVGAQSETLTVTEAAPLTESQSSHIAQTVNRQMLVGLPLPNRAASSLAALSPGVVIIDSGAGTAENYPVFTVAGGRARNQTFILDGANVSNAVGLTARNSSPASRLTPCRSFASSPTLLRRIRPFHRRDRHHGHPRRHERSPRQPLRVPPQQRLRCRNFFARTGPPIRSTSLAAPSAARSSRTRPISSPPGSRPASHQQRHRGHCPDPRQPLRRPLRPRREDLGSRHRRRPRSPALPRQRHSGKPFGPRRHCRPRLPATQPVPDHLRRQQLRRQQRRNPRPQHLRHPARPPVLDQGPAHRPLLPERQRHLQIRRLRQSGHRNPPDPDADITDVRVQSIRPTLVNDLRATYLRRKFIDTRPGHGDNLAAGIGLDYFAGADRAVDGEFVLRGRRADAAEGCENHGSVRVAEARGNRRYQIFDRYLEVLDRVGKGLGREIDIRSNVARGGRHTDDQAHTTDGWWRHSRDKLE